MICPRCDAENASMIFTAPADAAWELYRCPRCFFIWRNTEEPEVTDPALYDRRFKLSEKIIAEMKDKPAIPPLRETTKMG